MRIGLLAPPSLPVPPPAYGGIESVLDALATGLEAAGHEVLLWATGDSTSAVATGWTYPEAVGTSAGDPAFELRHVIDGYDALRAWGADVVHDHTVTGPIYARRFPDLPVVTTNHGPFDEERTAVLRAVHTPVIAISHAQAASHGEVPIVAVIHHGLDVADYPPGAGEAGYVACLARMSPTKGVHTAARVARTAGVPLRIAAKMRESAEREYYERRVAPLLGGEVDYVGELNGKDKLELLAGASCLLNPIAWPEPFGMVMIEALACGSPVVTTPCGAAPEIVEDGCIGFLRRTAKGLVNAVGRVPELDRGACRRAVKERFSTARMVADHVAVYAAVIERTGRSCAARR